jgi:hypothetical protein
VQLSSLGLVPLDEHMHVCLLGAMPRSVTVLVSVLMSERKHRERSDVHVQSFFSNAPRASFYPMIVACDETGKL